MGDFAYSDLIALDLGKLNTAATGWRSMAGELAKLATHVHNGLTKKADGARWSGVNATVSKDFVRKTANEFSDLRLEAESIANVLADAHAELTRYQRQAQSLTDDARKGDPAREPPDPGLTVFDGPGSTVRVGELICSAEGPDQRTKDRIEWFADTLTDIVKHAAEVDRAAVQALRRSHGNNPHNPGHGTYSSLDEVQLPRARELARLGGDASAKERAELRRVWESLSPAARGRLWLAHKDGLMDAGILSPTALQIAPDAGSGRHGSETAGLDEWTTRQKMRLLTEGADWKGMTDASRHMSHYLGNSGRPMNLPVDKMMADVPAFRTYVDDTVRTHQEDWRKQALEEFRKSGGKPVAFPVEVKQPEGFYFTQKQDPNWFYAVGGSNSNVTGVVTAVPGTDGEPEISLDYQANVWDRYNWDKDKGVAVGPLEIPDGEMARLHRAGVAQEFDMAGSSSVRHYDLGSATPNDDPLPGPEDSRDGRADPGREQQQDRTTGRASKGSDGR